MVEEVERYTFTVNGKTVTTTENKSLLRFLRDDLHLLSVKDGREPAARVRLLLTGLPRVAVL